MIGKNMKIDTIDQVFFSSCSKMEKMGKIVREIANLDVPVLIKGRERDRERDSCPGAP